MENEILKLKLLIVKVVIDVECDVVGLTKYVK
jgi:hypothetical protein